MTTINHEARAKRVGWIGVDLDGTLAHYDEWEGALVIGAPVVRMVERVKRWIADGYDVRILTAHITGWELPEYQSESGRSEVEDAIRRWSKEHIGCELAVTSAKDFNMIELWDDRAIQVRQNTGCPIEGSTSRIDRL